MLLFFITTQADLQGKCNSALCLDWFHTSDVYSILTQHRAGFVSCSGASLLDSKVNTSHPSLNAALSMTSEVASSQVLLLTLLQGKIVWPSDSASSLLPYYRAQENSSKYEQMPQVIEGLLNLKPERILGNTFIFHC